MLFDTPRKIDLHCNFQQLFMILAIDFLNCKVIIFHYGHNSCYDFKVPTVTISG